MKKFLLAGAIALFALSSCADSNEGTTTTGGESQMIEFPADEREEDRGVMLDGTVYERLRESPATMLQLTPLTVGEELAVLHTNHGDVTLRFFPEEAPKAVENFVTHARNGFYDGLIFHRVMPGFMIQGGCPQGTGRGGESIWGEGFGLERSFNLYHFRGALATAHAGPGTIGSQFYIVQAADLTPDAVGLFEHLIEVQDEFAGGGFEDGTRLYVRDIHPVEGLQHFLEQGGTHWLDWHWNRDNYGHTVFGHVVSGIEVVDAIANVAQGPQNRPVDDVIIERISFKIYGE